MITNYTDLQGEIKNYLHRGDLQANIPTFIQLAETRFNRNLRVRQMERMGTVNFVDGAADLPDGWLEFVGSPMVGTYQLGFIPRDRWDEVYTGQLGGNYYTIIGSQLYGTWDTAAGVSSGRVRYYEKIPALSDSTPTNWLIADAPDAYLYGALLEAEPFLKNDKRIETWRGFLQVALNDLQTSSDTAKYSGGSLVLGAPLI